MSSVLLAGVPQFIGTTSQAASSPRPDQPKRKPDLPKPIPKKPKQDPKTQGGWKTITTTGKKTQVERVMGEETQQRQRCLYSLSSREAQVRSELPLCTPMSGAEVQERCLRRISYCFQVQGGTTLTFTIRRGSSSTGFAC